MTKISKPQNLNTRAIASHIVGWFEHQHFELKISHENNNFYISARKTNAIRVALSANHAIIVGIQCEGNGTTIEVKQGSWETKIISNAVWLALTVGTNLLIAGWSLILQKDLENYIETTIFSDPIVLDPNAPVPFHQPSKSTTTNFMPERPLSNALESTASAVSKIGRDIANTTKKIIAKIVEKPKSNFCVKCGKKRQKDAKFCSNCGETFE